MARSLTEAERAALKAENKRLVRNKAAEYKRKGKKPFVVTLAGIMPQDIFDKNFRDATDPDFKQGGSE